jgi:hypothetical protein
VRSSIDSRFILTTENTEGLLRSVGDRRRGVDVTADRKFTQLKAGFAARTVFRTIVDPPVFSVSSVSSVVSRLADIKLRHQVETDVLESVNATIIGGDFAQELSGTPDHLIKVLDNQVIDLLGAQERFGHSV